MRLDTSTTAIITGGASGLGEATARLLASKGVNVVIADMNQQQGNKLSKQINASFYRTDVTNEQNVKGLFAFAVQKYKNIHIVVNSAGVATAGTIIYSKGVLETQIMATVLKINVIGTFNVSKHAALIMSKQELVEGQRGVIINVASVAGFEGQKGQVVYSASKGAIIGMTLPMARDLGKFSIRVMTIAPGVFQTPMGANVSPKALNPIINQTPLGRIGISHQFALTVKAIVENSYANGTVWRIDGGIRLPYL